MRFRPVRFLVLLPALLVGAFVSSVAAQGTATIRGQVTRAGDAEPLPGVQITVRGTGLIAATNTQGRYVMQRVPEGPQTIVFRWLGYVPVERQVTVLERIARSRRLRCSVTRGIGGGAGKTSAGCSICATSRSGSPSPRSARR